MNRFKCDKCEGSGEIPDPTPMLSSSHELEYSSHKPCPHCEGSGYMVMEVMERLIPPLAEIAPEWSKMGMAIDMRKLAPRYRPLTNEEVEELWAVDPEVDWVEVAMSGELTFKGAPVRLVAGCH